MKKNIMGVLITVLGLSLSVIPAFAHVVVKPSVSEVGSFQTFSVGVPNEKDVPTTGLKLLVPEGLASVTPNVKAGWTITVKKSGDGERVTEIDWIGGSIPEGQRDDFYFSAQVPANETTLIWKVYQTYQDGEVVSWDQNGAAAGHDEEVTPYASTVISNNVAVTKTQEAQDRKEQNADTLWRSIAMVGLVLSVASIGIQLRKKA